MAVDDEDFFSLYERLYSLFFLPHPFLNAAQLRCTNDARPGMGERFLLQERRSGGRAEMASVDGPSVDWPRLADAVLEKVATKHRCKARLVVGSALMVMAIQKDVKPEQLVANGVFCAGMALLTAKVADSM